MQQVANDVWTVTRPLRFFGLQIGTRMTVVRLQGGALWVHSPIPPDPGLAGELEALGSVRYVVAPNKLHHLFAGEFQERFPEAELYLAPGLRRKRPDLAECEELEESARYPWSEEVDFHLLRGMRYLNEVVFHPRASRTLIVSDLLFNLGSDKPWLTRLFARLNGTYRKLACPRDVRLLLVANRSSFQGSIETIGGWDFDRIILAHGDPVLEDARPAFDQAFAFLRTKELSA